MGRTRLESEEAVASFNKYFDGLTREQQNNYAPLIWVDGKYEYGEPRKASITTYEHCMSCGGSYVNFRATEEGDCPDGVTINPILHYDEPLRLNDINDAGTNRDT
jgi:hypothetical protein